MALSRTLEKTLEQGVKPNTIRVASGAERVDAIIAGLEKVFAAAR